MLYSPYEKISLALALLLLLYLLLFPPRWYLNLTKRVEVSAETGAALAEKYKCRQCHILGEQGALYAPDLDKSMGNTIVLGRSHFETLTTNSFGKSHKLIPFPC